MSAPQPLSVGIVGTGLIGPVHAAAIRRAGARIVAVASATQGEAEAAARAWGAERAETDAEALIASPDIDVVHVCTPNDLHATLATLALKSGKHVVCEKPLALSVGEASQLAREAQTRGLVSAVPFIYRYHAMAWEAHRRVQDGAIGEVHLIHGSYLQDWLMGPDSTNWRVSATRGGRSRAFADIGSHWCDLIEWVTGHRIAELSATMGTVVRDRPTGTGGSRAPVDTEDTASIVFRTDREAVGSLVVSQVSPGRKNRLWFEVDGDASSIVFDQEQPDHLWLGDAEGARLLVRSEGTLSKESARLSIVPAGHPQGFLDAFAAFVADVYSAIRGESVPAFPTFVDGVRSCRLTEAVLASAESRKWIEVAP